MSNYKISKTHGTNPKTTTTRRIISDSSISATSRRNPLKRRSKSCCRTFCPAAVAFWKSKTRSFPTFAGTARNGRPIFFAKPRRSRERALLSIRGVAIHERKGPRSVIRKNCFPGGRNVGVSIPSKYRAHVRRLSLHAISSPEFSYQRSWVAPRQEPLFGWHGTLLKRIAFSREVDGRGNNRISAECPTADD